MTTSTFTPVNDWRYTTFRPSVAHLWGLTPGGVWRSQCEKACVLDRETSTCALAVNNTIRKCRSCLPHERRRRS